jgi:hypothetical protein
MRIFPGDDEFMGCAAGYTLTRTSRNEILFMYGHPSSAVAALRRVDPSSVALPVLRTKRALEGGRRVDRKH